MKSPAKLRAIELLFEIGCEEIPAGMLPKAEEDLRLNLEKLLAAENLSADTTVETFSPPRRGDDVTWPRAVTWTGLDGPRFIRPIRWVVAVLDGKPLRLEVAGVAAGNATRGHRFLGSSAIRVRHFLDYEKKLHANGVIIRPARRREKIARELEAFVKRGNYRMHEDREIGRAHV